MGNDHVTGIGGIFLRADNPAQLSAWYASNLGIEPMGGVPDSDSKEPVSALFMWRDHESPETEGLTTWALFPRSSEYLGDGPCMVNFRVADLDGLVAKLTDSGVWVDPHREDHEYGRFAWIKDAEGNRIELWEPAGE
jgi:predicted enzyme related to lactoylglutathione lyase